MRYVADEHASSCKAMLLTITSIGICKKVTEVTFFKYCYVVSRTAPICSQRPANCPICSYLSQTVASAPKGALAPTLRTSALASCRSPTAPKRADKSKQCHCLQYGQSATQASCIALNSYLFFT